MPKVKSTKAKAKSNKFDYSLDYENLDLRANPELYRIGKGEQGVLLVQPYKRELLGLWRFATVEKATNSSEALYRKFIEYRDGQDFIGCDMARKFIQMGFTRARRYTNHKGGKKYEVAEGGEKVEIPRLAIEDQDKVKAESARIFKVMLEKVNGDSIYMKMKQEHQDRYS